jgi:hypothetical protein
MFIFQLKLFFASTTLVTTMTTCVFQNSSGEFNCDELLTFPVDHLSYPQDYVHA